jgi:hypothetical protein
VEAVEPLTLVVVAASVRAVAGTTAIGVGGPVFTNR